MNKIDHLNRTFIPAWPKPSFSLQACSQGVSEFTLNAIHYLSPKQSVRSDFYETIKTVAFKAKTNVEYQLWKVSKVFRGNIAVQEGAEYLNALALLKTLSSDYRELTGEEKEVLNRIFLRAFEDKEFLSTFDFFVIAAKDHSLKKQHKSLKDLVSVCQSGTFQAFKNKLEKLVKIDDLQACDALSESEKLTVYDINIVVSLATPIMKNLTDNGIATDHVYFSKLLELDCLVADPFFEKLKQACLESRPSGTVFVGDRRTYQAIGFSSFDCAQTVQALFLGRMEHMGIYAIPPSQGLYLSHVNFVDNHHSLLPVLSIFFQPFHIALTIDIKPLLSTNLPLEKQQEFADIFSEEFKRLALIEQPLIGLATTKEHVKLVALGHTAWRPHPLDKVDYPSTYTPTLCSSYVALTFLKAIQKVNEALYEQGLEQIAHPFGEYENIENIDVLRLVYLLKDKKLIKPVMNDTLSKVLSYTSPLKL